MSCGCQTYTCVDVFTNPCNAGTEIAIQATQTGNWRAMLEFNGAYREFSFGVISGQNISFPTIVLNEYYAHELRLYDVNNEALGCYWLKSRLTQSVADYPVIPPSSDVWQWGTLTGDGTPNLDSELLTGDISPIIWINEQDQDWAQQGITQTATGLLFPYNLSGTIIFQYKNIPA